MKGALCSLGLTGLLPGWAILGAALAKRDKMFGGAVVHRKSTQLSDVERQSVGDNFLATSGFGGSGATQGPPNPLVASLRGHDWWRTALCMTPSGLLHGFEHMAENRVPLKARPLEGRPQRDTATCRTNRDTAVSSGSRPELSGLGSRHRLALPAPTLATAPRRHVPSPSGRELGRIGWWPPKVLCSPREVGAAPCANPGEVTSVIELRASPKWLHRMMPSYHEWV